MEFLIGQRAIYNDYEIVTILALPNGRHAALSLTTGNMRQYVRFSSGNENYVEPTCLKSLPGGQL